MEPLIVRTSDRNIFKSCRLRWDWTSKVRQNLEPAFPPQVLEFGTAVHAGLEALYDPLLWDKPANLREAAALSAFTLECNRQRAAYVSAIQDEGLSPEKTREFDEEMELGLGMLKHYFQWYPTVDKFRPVKVEIEFEVPIKYLDGTPLIIQGRPVVYQGRTDLLAEDDYGYWNIDHKTAGSLSNPEWLELDDVGASYCWALHSQLGLPLQGSIYNRLLKDVPSPPERLKKQREGRWFSVNKQMRCTYELYLETLKAAGEPLHLYRDHLQHLQDRGNPFFQRYTVRRTLRQQELQSQQIILEAIDMFGNPSIYPSPGLFNCMGCSYKAPCLIQKDGGDTTLTLQTMFRKRA